MKDDMLKKIYMSLADEESKIWFRGKVEYALSGDKFKLYDVIYKLQGDEMFSKWDLGLLEEDFYKDKDIIIFGTGNFGEHTYFVLKHSSLADKVIAFMDSSSQKWGKKMHGIDILSPTEVLENHRNAIIIFASELYCEDMYFQLAHMHFPQYNMFLPKCRKLTAGKGWQYYDLFEATENEIYVDAGAYDGQTALDFVKWCGGSYGKIYSFEPSEVLVKTIEKKFKENNIDKYEIISKAVWSKDDVLFFDNDVTSTASSSSCITSDGKWKVETTSIDKVLDGRPATFIKMDVEGSELEALKGAKETIMKYHPRLAISIYHKREDIYEIPAYILSIVPDYKLYIRHYSSDVYETVLYAI